MRIVVSGLFVIFSLIFSSPAVMALEYPWQVRMDKEGISVYTRRVEVSPILEYKANVIVD